MSKFFIQMLLSVVVAVSAAIGFSPNVKGDVDKALREAKSFAHQVGQSIFHTAAGVEAESEVSAESSAETSLEGEIGAEVESEINTDVELDLEKAHKKSKSLERSVDSSLSVESDSEAEIETDHGKLDVEKALESTLELETNNLP